MADPYTRLVELTRSEHDAVLAGDWEQVAAIQTQQVALRSTLAGPPPATARPSLEEAARLNAEIGRAIERAAAGVRAELVEIGRGRQAAVGYAAAGTQRPQSQLAWQG